MKLSVTKTLCDGPTLRQKVVETSTCAYPWNTAAIGI
jgi:hypothetical protein